MNMREVLAEREDMYSQKPKISVLMAVYNGEKSLHSSLESLLAQTLKEIEIICVDDASTDHSREVIQEYAKKDFRIRLIAFSQNRGTVCARKAGVEAAQGEYIMFMDQDDIYRPFACEELYRMIREKKVEILHYRSQVIPIPPTTEIAAKNQEEFMRPYNGYLYGTDVFDFCFQPDEKDEKIWNFYTWNVWNKIYRGELCKQAMEDCKEDYVVNGDDVYVYMLIAFYASSYFGDAYGECYHIYRYGTGLMGHYKLSLKKFYPICKRMTGYYNEELFFQEKNLKEQYKDALALDFCRSLNGIVTRWHQRLEPEDYGKGFDMMLEYVPYTEVIMGLHRHVRIGGDALVKAVAKAKSLKSKKNREKLEIIGIYLSGEKALPDYKQKKIIKELIKRGYKIQVFATEKKARWEGALSLPGEQQGKVYEYPLKSRIEALDSYLQKKNIGLYLYLGKKEQGWVYDWLCVKCNGIPVAFEEEFLWGQGVKSLFQKTGKYFCNQVEAWVSAQQQELKSLY